MKRYKVTISVNMSAINRKEAAQMFKEIVESGSTTTPRGTFLNIKLYEKPIVEVLPF